MNANKATRLIVGVGNPLRCDDGVGAAVIAWLEQQNLPSGIDIIQHYGEGLSLLEAWQDYAEVVLIDATRSRAPVGTVQRFNAIEAALPSELFHYSSHLFGVAEAVELARSLQRLPPTMLVYGIEGADFGYGDLLSPAVAAAVAVIGRELIAA